MLADQTDQRHQAHLGIDVHARQAEEQRHQRPAHGQRYGDQDHQRIAEALELCGQDQEDHRQRQGKGQVQRIAFLHVLPRRAGVIEAEALRRFLAGDGLQRFDRLAHADDGKALDHRGVELLELLELSRPGAVAYLDQGRERQHLALLVAHVVVAQPVGVVAVGAFDLGDDLVAAALDGEAVDLALAEQGAQGQAEVFHGDAHLRGLLAVDLDHDLRLVERQVHIEEGELAGLLGALADALGHLQQRFVVVGGIDHELERQAFAGAGQRRQVETEDLQAGQAIELGLYLGQDFHLRALALVPGFEQEAANAALHAIEAVDLEPGVVLREALEYLQELVGVGVQVVQVGGLRCAGHHEDDTLVLLGRQFALGEHQQHRNQCQHQHGEHQDHRAGVEGAVQGALVALLEAFEQLIQAMGEAAGVFFVAQQLRTHHRR